MKKYEEITYEKYSDQSQVVALTRAGSRVLDMGCASGPISMRLKEKGCEVIGIEIDPMAARKARKYCRRVIIADLDAVGEIDYPENYFDVIIYSNVLEHLKNPLLVLKRFDKYLKNEGYIVVVLPNIAHWLFRFEHLLGNFTYRKCGVMDATHLRFYTKKTGINLLTKAGYRVEKTYFTVSGLFIPLIKKFDFLQSLIYLITKIRPTFFAPQFIFLAKKDQ